MVDFECIVSILFFPLGSQIIKSTALACIHVLEQIEEARQA